MDITTASTGKAKLSSARVPKAVLRSVLEHVKLKPLPKSKLGHHDHQIQEDKTMSTLKRKMAHAFSKNKHQEKLVKETKEEGEYQCYIPETHCDLEPKPGVLAEEGLPSRRPSLETPEPELPPAYKPECIAAVAGAGTIEAKHIPDGREDSLTNDATGIESEKAKLGVPTTMRAKRPATYSLFPKIKPQPAPLVSRFIQDNTVESNELSIFSTPANPRSSQHSIAQARRSASLADLQNARAPSRAKKIHWISSLRLRRSAEHRAQLLPLSSASGSTVSATKHARKPTPMVHWEIANLEPQQINKPLSHFSKLGEIDPKLDGVLLGSVAPRKRQQGQEHQSQPKSSRCEERPDQDEKENVSLEALDWLAWEKHMSDIGRF